MNILLIKDSAVDEPLIYSINMIHPMTLLIRIAHITAYLGGKASSRRTGRDMADSGEVDPAWAKFGVYISSACQKA
jgi:hypothetical protein